MAQKKTVTVKLHKRSKPSPVRRINPDKPKPGSKNVPVRKHKRTPPN